MGAFEEAKGKAKAAVGELTDNPDLVREGEAQKDKGEAEHEATEARVEAKAHEAKAEVARGPPGGRRAIEVDVRGRPTSVRQLSTAQARPHRAGERGEVDVVQDAGDAAVAVVPPVLAGRDVGDVERRLLVGDADVLLEALQALVGGVAVDGGDAGEVEPCAERVVEHRGHLHVVRLGARHASRSTAGSSGPPTSDRRHVAALADLEGRVLGGRPHDRGRRAWRGVVARRRRRCTRPARTTSDAAISSWRAAGVRTPRRRRRARRGTARCPTP